jgi:hypothetical protein
MRWRPYPWDRQRIIIDPARGNVNGAKSASCPFWSKEAVDAQEGALGGIRTPDLLIRSQMLSSTELRAQPIHYSTRGVINPKRHEGIVLSHIYNPF